MNITIEDLRPLMTEIARLLQGELEDGGDTLLLKLPTQKYRNFDGDPTVEIVVRLHEGKMLLRCVEFCRLEGPYWPQLFAACLLVQGVPDSAVQFVALPHHAGACLGTFVELPLEDSQPSVRQLSSCVMDLHGRTDAFYEPLMEVLRTGQFERVNRSLGPDMGAFLNQFRPRS